LADPVFRDETALDEDVRHGKFLSHGFGISRLHRYAAFLIAIRNMRPHSL
jgi:hypothetical protein